ncbi:uncharacterized protein [Phyllobates terribilis]|uniref:uncharacterized protein n=1 Tax=Phyllobates terribilis TaxID=111132 RepID=UPI003CCA94F4
MERKRAKLNRDKTDYDRGQAYKWKHRGNLRRFSSTKFIEGGSSSSVGRSDHFLSSETSDTDGGRDGENASNGSKKTSLNSARTMATRTKIIFRVIYSKSDVPSDLSSPTDRQVFSDLLELLRDNQAYQGRQKFPHRLPSKILPSLSMVPAVFTFFEVMKDEIRRLPANNLSHQNLTNMERRALLCLQKNQEFLIKEADKGGNVVLWPRDMYTTEVHRQLNNSRFYLRLPSDPTQIFSAKFERLILKAFSMGIINKQEKDFMMVRKPTIPTFYILPKVHKDLVCPPGRPIVSGIGSICEKACIYVDFFLQPLATSLPSYLRDSSHLIQSLNSLSLPDQFLLITVDVESLYSNIAHQDGIAAVLHFLNNTSGVYFLDLEIRIVGGSLVTKLYRKSTATNSLLHYQSFHPRNLRDSIPVGQFSRAKRNCTTQDDFKTEASNLTTRFRERGYPKSIISKAHQRIIAKPREVLLQPRADMEDTQIRFITRFNNQWNEVGGLFRKHWNILKTDHRLSSILSNKPLLTARRAPNLRDKLVHSHYLRPLYNTSGGNRLKGSFPCGNCSACPFFSSEKIFTNPTDNRQFPLRDYINCRSTNVIYALTCPCPKVYVGQTSQELRRRVQQHASNIHLAEQDLRKGRTISTVALHFLQFHSSSTNKLRVTGLQKMKPNPRNSDHTRDLLRTESRWIFTLDTVAPKGINEDLSFTGYLA